MSQANKDLVMRWITAAGAGDGPALSATMSPDVVIRTMGSCALSGTRNHQEAVDLVSALGTYTVSGIDFTVDGFTAEGGRVAVELRGSSAFKNGDRYDNEYHMLFEIEGDRITAVREYLDTILVDRVITPLLSG